MLAKTISKLDRALVEPFHALQFVGPVTDDLPESVRKKRRAYRTALSAYVSGSNKAAKGLGYSEVDTEIFPKVEVGKPTEPEDARILDAVIRGRYGDVIMGRWSRELWYRLVAVEAVLSDKMGVFKQEVARVKSGEVMMYHVHGLYLEAICGNPFSPCSAYFASAQRKAALFLPAFALLNDYQAQIQEQAENAFPLIESAKWDSARTTTHVSAVNKVIAAIEAFIREKDAPVEGGCKVKVTLREAEQVALEVGGLMSSRLKECFDAVKAIEGLEFEVTVPGSEAAAKPSD